MPPAATLILASTSPRRRALLGALGRPFTVDAADLDESQRPGERPAAYASRLALAKAHAVAGRVGQSGHLVVGADTIVVLDDTILGKPASPDEARAYLRRLRGRRHVVITAVAVVDAASGSSWEGLAWTGVWLRAFSDEELEAYVATGDPLDKAGAYAIQHGDFRPVARLEGSELNVIGLPLMLLEQLLNLAECG